MKFKPMNLGIDTERPYINERNIVGYGSILKVGMIQKCKNEDFLLCHINGYKQPFFIATKKLKTVLKDKPKKKGMWKDRFTSYAFIFRRNFENKMDVKK